MAIPLTQQFICPILIGRVPLVEALQDTLDGLTTGQGRTILLAGEAGLGKSRLVAEVKARAERLGYRILEGACFEPDRALPYAPIADLVRAWVTGRRGNDLARALGPAGPELATLLPELRTLLPDLAPATRAGEPDQEQRRRCQAVVQFLAHLAADRPVVAIVEDLHWSDDTSLELLLHLAHRFASHPVLLVLTYRADEVGPKLGELLAELDRRRLAVELAVSPLDAAEVASMLRAILGDAPVPADIVGRISALADGNPFFVEEVLKSLAAAGDLERVDGAWQGKPTAELRIPRSVQDAARGRVARLGQGARRLLTLAAVAGRRFDFELLQAVTRHDEASLLMLMKELIGQQLVAEESADQFVFRHALTREAVYADLLGRERRALHHQIGEAIERLAGEEADARSSDLAYHFFAAGAWHRALVYAREAGQRAQAMHAPSTAVEQFSRALEAAAQLSVPPPTDVLRARGLAFEIVGDFERARADHEAAIEQARTDDDLPTEWRALLDLALLWAGRDYQRSGAYTRSAVALARSMDDSAALAHSLNRLGNWLTNAEQVSEALEHHREALAVFERLDDRRGIAETLDFLGMASITAADQLQSFAYYERALPLLEALDDRQRLVIGLTMTLITSGSYVGDVAIAGTMTEDEAVRRGDLALKLARDMGWRSGEAFVLVELPPWQSYRGRFAEAMANAQAALAIAREIEHRQWEAFAQLSIGGVYLDVLMLSRARHHFDRALGLAKELGSMNLISQATSLLAMVSIAQRELARAGELLDTLPDPDTSALSMGQRHCAATRAELLLAQGDAVRALEIVERLIASDPNAGSGRITPRLWKLRGEALLALGRHADAETALREARDSAAAYGARPLLWRVRVSLGRLYRRAGRHAEAGQAFAAARAVIEELATELSDEGMRTAFLEGAAGFLPRLRPPSPGRIAREAFGGLSPREREVSALIAQGRSNRAIAESLMVTERTVEGYVGNVLAKLGFSSRTQIAAWAVERGLPRTP